MSWEKEKQIVIAAAQELSRKGLVIGTMGNVSLRIPGSGEAGLIAITPSNKYYDTLTADDIVVINSDGEVVEGKLKPSSEKMLHAGIYRKHPEINAVIHFHSQYSSTVAVSFNSIPPILEDQVICLGGEIRVADYAFSGSQELIDNAIAALDVNKAVILANHGALCIGHTMRDVFTNCEMLEKTALVYINAALLGKVNLLSASAIEKAKSLFNSGYGNQ
jgi:L-fuculose-phosphate aldolase